MIVQSINTNKVLKQWKCRRRDQRMIVVKIKTLFLQATYLTEKKNLEQITFIQAIIKLSHHRNIFVKNAGEKRESRYTISKIRQCFQINKRSEGAHMTEKDFNVKFESRALL